MESTNYKQSQKIEKKAVSRIAVLNRKSAHGVIAKIPNALTILRIIMVPLVVVLMLVQFDISGKYLYQINPSSDIAITIHFNMLLAAIFFILACITDLLDGFIARKFNVVSEFGKIWDPIADKALINSVLIAMASPSLNFLPPWIPILFILRDIIINAFRMNAVKKDIDVAANIYGKIKTVLEMIGIIVIFFIGTPKIVRGEINITTSVWYWYGIQEIVIYFALIASFWSGIKYLVDIRFEVRNREHRY